MISILENEFLEEVCCDVIPPRSSIESDDLLLEPFAMGFGSSNGHPLLLLISVYAQNQLVWKSAKDTLDRKLLGISDVEKTIWKVEKNCDALKGICRDGCEVSLKYDYETAKLDSNQLGHLESLQKELRSYLLDQLSMTSFKVAISRLEIESYLAQILRQCPAFENFSPNEPVILLPERNLDPELERQIKLLRAVTSVLFTCLRQLTFIDVAETGTVAQHELIDDLIGWITCITGRLVRQCRLKDHVYVMMQLLRVPFNITYTPPAIGSSLCALLQPPVLDIAWFRVEGRSLDFLSEPEVEARGTLFALCLRILKKGFQINHPGESNLQKSAVLRNLDTSSGDGEQKWTVVDSDGESDVEWSATSSTSEKHANSSLLSGRFDLKQDIFDVKGVSALIDQVDMPGLIEFLNSHCDEIGTQNNHVVLFSFANWLITTLEQAADFLQTPREDVPRFQRKLVKQITAVISTLLSGLWSLINRAIAPSSNPPLPSLYPNLHGHDSTDVKVILAQYDELCLRVTSLLLSNAASFATKLTCWRRFARMSPLHLFSSRAKLRFYLLLISAISPHAGDVEGDFCDTRFLVHSEDMQPMDETVTEEGKMDGVEVVELLRAALIDQGCLADPFITVLGQIASQECRPPPPPDDQEPTHLWLSSGIPVVERLLVGRILDILFRLCTVPTLQSGNEECDGSKLSFDAIPISTICGRAQIMAIVSAHPAFAFQHLLDLIITSAVQLDTTTAVSTNIPQRPDLSSCNVSAELLLDLIDALPPTPFTPNADDLDRLFCWIGGHPTSELLPLTSLRSQISQKLLNILPWEAVNNTTGEYFISAQIQAWAAVAVATAFQRRILESHRQPVLRLSETLKYYAKSVLPRRSPTHSRRSSSLSPPRIPSSSTTYPPVPFDSESASIYHWTMELILRLHLEPSTEALSRLLNATDQSQNPLTTFLIIEFQLRQQPRPPLPTDRDACRALLNLASLGHFALAIEAFSRLSICHEAEKRKYHSSVPCESFKEFVHCMLKLDEVEYVNESFMSYLWGKWGLRFWRHKEAKNETARRGIPRGPVLEAFLGATLNASIGCAGEDEKHSLLQAVILSTFSFVLTGGRCLPPQAIWLLENLLKTAFWVEESFPYPKQSKTAHWWQHPIIDVFRPSSLKKIAEERSDIASKTLEGTSAEGFTNPLYQNCRITASSWAEGLSILIPAEGFRFYTPLFRSSAAAVATDSDESEGAVRLAMIQDLLRRASEDDEGPFWLIAYLIGADCNAGDMFGEYSLWDDVVDTITWNRSIILAVDYSRSGSKDTSDGEKCVTSVFIEAGLLTSTSAEENLGRLTRHLPLVQAVSALVVCPLHHPAFFLLLQLAITHCFAFSRTAGDPSINLSKQCVSCFPPGFLLLRTLSWDKHNLSVNYNTGIRSSVLDTFLCRLREALRYWLKRDSQDDVVDPYGLHSSNAVSLLRMTTSLLSDLEQAVAYRTPDTLNVCTMLERLKSFNVNSALQSVSLDSIASKIYAEIDRWHFLRGTHRPVKEDVVDRSMLKFSVRRLDPPNVQQCGFDETSMYGPLDIRPDRWYALVQVCVESLKNVALMATERDRELQNLHKKQREGLLPRLYKSITCHQSEVVECQPFIPIPVMTSRSCKGGARITQNYQTAQLDVTVEAENTEVRRRIAGLVEEAWSAAFSAVTTVSCRQSIAAADLLPPSVPRVDEPGEGVMRGTSGWVLSSFRLVSVLQRIFGPEKVKKAHMHDCTEQLISIFHLLCQISSGPAYAFPPTKVVLSQCVDIMAENLLSSGDCGYEMVLDALTGSRQLLQLLAKLWPRLLEASLQAKPGGRVKHFLSVYRCLPLIVQQCGAQIAHDLLTKVLTLGHPFSENRMDFVDHLFPPLLGDKTEDPSPHSPPAKSAAKFGGAAQLDNLIIEAFHCLVAVNTQSNHDDASKDLVELIRGQVVSYFEFNFPHTVIHLLENAFKAQNPSTQEELWNLTKVAICNNFSTHFVYPLSTDDIRHFLEKANERASLAYDGRDLSASTKGAIIECLGTLNQQLGVKLSRCVELDHLPLQIAHNILMQSVLNYFWPRVIDADASPNDGGILQRGLTKLADIIADLYASRETIELPRLFNAFLNAFVTRIFCKPFNLTEVHLLDQLNQACATHAERCGLLEGFPWAVWQPTACVLSILTEFITTPPQSVRCSVLVALSYMLSRVCWDNPPTDVHLAEHVDKLVALTISIVCWYDAVEDKQKLISCSENLRRFMEGCRIFLLKQHSHARLLPDNLAKIKLRLRPNDITNTSDLVFWISSGKSCTIVLLSLASHVGENYTKTYTFTATLDPSLFSMCTSTPEIVAQRRAFVSLCVDLLIAVDFADEHEVPASTATKEDQPVEPSTSTPSRAYSLLMTGVLPVASCAIGAIVNSITSCHLWKQVFGTRQSTDAEVSDAFAKLTECEGPVRGFVWRICSLLSDLEGCCAVDCWDSVNSNGFKETVSYCEELLRLWSINGSLSSIVDATFVCWMSERPIGESSTSLMSMEEIGQVRTRTLCRPLLRALLYHLSIVSTCSSLPSSVSSSEQASQLQSPPPFVTVISLIDKCLWILLQTNPSRCNLPTIPTDFETRMMRICEVFEDGFKVETQANSRFGNSGSWLVPTCLSCKKLLPLFAYAYARWIKIVSAADNRSSSEPSIRSNQRRSAYLSSASDSPAILLADVMHWFAVLDLSPSDVCADNCTASTQLTGVLLLLHLSLKLLLSVEDLKACSSSQKKAPQIHAFLNCLQVLITKWEVLTHISGISQKEANFVTKFCEMTNCLIGLVEEWQISRGGVAGGDSADANRGLARLQSGGDEGTSSRGDRSATDIAQSAVCALLTHLHDQTGDTDSPHSPAVWLMGEHLLTAFVFLCQRLWSPLPNFVDSLLAFPLCTTSIRAASQHGTG
uniref:Ectopic p granules protein n=1 Tax=Echinococcus granulosus TaxID=6210 RepID=A0A068WSD2_ECHGR|nr:ectopic p granules protein [Echinococcus granulosus]